MKKIPCSVGILTFNSEQTLVRALESVKDFDEIIICDGGSTDGTLEIAHKFGCKIIRQDMEGKNDDNTIKDYSHIRNQCLRASKYDWFFYIDSDEIATPNLVEEIRDVLSKPMIHYVYNISPRIVIENKVIKYSSNYPGWQKRFFNRRSGAYFIKKIHERITYNAKKYSMGYLENHWYYWMPAQWNKQKSKKYAYMDAQLHYQKNLNLFIQLLFSKIVTILKFFVKTMFLYFRFGYKNCTPLSIEWGRIIYQVYIIKELFRIKFNK